MAYIGLSGFMRLRPSTLPRTYGFRTSTAIYGRHHLATYSCSSFTGSTTGFYIESQQRSRAQSSQIHPGLPVRSYFSTTATYSQAALRFESRGILHCALSNASKAHEDRHNLRSSLSLSVLAAVVCLGLLIAHLQSPASSEGYPVAESTADMSYEVPPGRPGNLTPEEEEKLRQLWTLIFKVCAVKSDEAGAVTATPVTTNGNDKAESVQEEKPKKKSTFSVFSRRGRKDSEAEPTPAPTPNGLITPKEGDEDKYGQTKHFYDTLASQSPESIRDTIWSMVKHDHPDALALRFLRARKWDVEKALIMMVSTMNWRSQDVHVDDDIIKNGEAGALEVEKSDDPKAAELARGFIAQARMGKSFLHGVDREGRPICYVRVRFHRASDQLQESLERYTVYLIETARLLLTPPVDTAVSSSSLKCLPFFLALTFFC